MRSLTCGWRPVRNGLSGASTIAHRWVRRTWRRARSRQDRNSTAVSIAVSKRAHAAQSGNAFTKIVRFLARSAEGEGPFSVHIGSQQALGEELGVSRDSVVRALRRLRKENIVTTHRRLVSVREPGMLRAHTR